MITRREIDLDIFNLRQERREYLKAKGPKLAVMRPEHLMEFSENVLESLDLEEYLSNEAYRLDQESLRPKRERRNAFLATLGRKIAKIHQDILAHPPKDEHEAERYSRRFQRVHDEIARCVPLPPSVKTDA